jgi:hypothetical protein
MAADPTNIIGNDAGESKLADGCCLACIHWGLPLTKAAGVDHLNQHPITHSNCFLCQQLIVQSV